MEDVSYEDEGEYRYMHMCDSEFMHPVGSSSIYMNYIRMTSIKSKKIQESVKRSI